MTNYTKTTDFAAKDALPSGNAAKIVKGSEIDAEFDNIATSSATKANKNNSALTGTTTFETISDGTIAITAFVDEDNMVSNSATLLPTQQSVKAYVDSQVTAQDLDFQADTGGALSIDLDSETITFTGGTGIDTSGALNAVTFAIDSTVATLTGTQTLSNKTLSTPAVSGNLTTDGLIDGRDVATDGTKLDGIESGATADQTAAEIKTAYESNADTNAFTDADHTKLDGIEANATADQTAAEIKTAYESNLNTNAFTDADESKLDGIEAGADVTDTANVTAAGALMDSELTSEASVKALNQGVATTDSPTFAGIDVTGTATADKLIVNSGATDEVARFEGTGSPYISWYDTGVRQAYIGSFGNNFSIIGDTPDTTVSISTGGTPRLTVDATGVGIGTIAPASKLHVNTGSAGYGLTLAASSQTSGTYQLGIDSASNLAIYDTAAASQRLVISNAGNVGIGTSPDTLLNIAAQAAPTFRIENTDTSLVGAQTLGDIDFYQNDPSGTGVGVVSKIRSVNESTFQGQGALAFHTGTASGLTERMRIDSAGNVGIGTTTPGNFQLNINGSGDGGRQLKVEGPSTNGLMRFSNSTSQDYSIGINNTSFIIYDDTANTYRMVVDSSGKVLIGTTATSFNERLTVNSNSAPYSAHLFAGSGATAPLICRNANGVSGTRSQIIFYYDASTVGSITSTSSSTSYTSPSDQRLKENIADADDAGSKVDAIQVRKFDWIADGSHQDYGMIAQELQSVAPESVTGDADSEEMMGVDYSKLVPMLVKEIQSLRARVANLENN